MTTATPTQPPDLLTCLIAFLKTNASVSAALADGQIYSMAAPANTDPPFIVVDGYMEEQPGEDLEDMKIELSILVRAASLDQCRSIATAIKTAVDTPTINPRASGRDPFAWTTGSEHTVFRDTSKPERLKGLNRGNSPYGYREQIEYEFWVSPVQ